MAVADTPVPLDIEEVQLEKGFQADIKRAVPAESILVRLYFVFKIDINS